jgi:hypothetical protein
VPAEPGPSEPGHHYRLDDGSILCGAAQGLSTRNPWDVTCRVCFAVARAESVGDDRSKPHPWVYIWHCLDCSAGPIGKWERNYKPWDGRWQLTQMKLARMALGPVLFPVLCENTRRFCCCRQPRCC